MNLLSAPQSTVEPAKQLILDHKATKLAENPETRTEDVGRGIAYSQGQQKTKRSNNFLRKFHKGSTICLVMVCSLYLA